MTSQFADRTSSSNFLQCLVSIVKFSYLDKFYVSISTGSGVRRFSVYKELTRNAGIGNTPV